MARSIFSMDNSGVNELVTAMQNFEGDVEGVVNNVLHDIGGQEISENIKRILPVSGRTWSGKAPAAKTSQPFQQINSNLSVTVKSKSRYNYLYFPDDGSNTKHHVGNQQFMITGADNSSDFIINTILDDLVANIERS